ncbi:MAG: radical SAM protein [Nitrospirales bacterium]|nr:radical SAM protein [Nitrospirales bacterium]
MANSPGRTRDYCYHDSTLSLCRACGQVVDARILFRDGRVFLRSLCPEHGPSEAVIASSVEWYLTVMKSRQATDRPRIYSRGVSRGCPYDCGLCTWHEKACNLPVFSITNACNLQCPICFTYNRSDRRYFMSADEFRSILDWISESEGYVDLINITGGEPTLHPDLFALLRLCDRNEIGRVTLNSNGIVLAEDEDFVRRLADHGVYVILSFNTLSPERSRRIHGTDLVDIKLRALDNLERHNVQTTLLNVSIKNLNDGEIGSFFDLMLQRPFIRSLTVQTMTYTGFGGSSFMPREHLPIDEVITNLTSNKNGLSSDDFAPLPGSHPLCYSVCYLFHDESHTVPLRRIFTSEEYSEILGAKYLIRPDEKFQELLRDKIGQIWAERDSYPQAEETLRLMKRMISLLYPSDRALSSSERQRRAEGFVKTIYIHSHMDEDTFDLSRIVRCGDLVPDVNRTYVPACAYNLLYRMKDERFWRET